jgi:hypothetical protein
VYGVKDGKKQILMYTRYRRLYIFWQEDTGLAPAHNSGRDIGPEGGKKRQKFVGLHDNYSVDPTVIGIYTNIAAVK